MVMASLTHKLAEGFVKQYSLLFGRERGARIMAKHFCTTVP